MNHSPQNQKQQMHFSVLCGKGRDRFTNLPILTKFIRFLRWASGLEDHVEREKPQVNQGYPLNSAKSRSLHCIMLLLGMIIPGMGTIHATQVVPLSLNETVRQADSIVLGTVTEKQSRWGDASRRWIVTDYTFAVEDVFFAPGGPEAVAKNIKVTYWGGEVDGEGQGVSDARLPVVKERLLLMLKPGWEKEVHFSPLVGFNQGLFQITSAEAGKPAMVQDAEGAPLRRQQNGSITKKNPGANAAAAEPAVDLDSFVSWLRTNAPVIKAGASELRPQASLDDPRVMKTFRLPIESNAGAKLNSKGPSRSPASSVEEAKETSPSSTPPGPTSKPTHEEQKAQVQPLPGEGQDGSAYSFPRTASPPIVVNNFPDSFAPWSPEDEYQMAKWNHYANIFQVFVTPTGNWAWQNDRFDLCGWPSSADMQAQFGAGWDANTIGICWTRWYTSNNIIIEGDIALNPAFSFTLDDEWVYDGSSAQGFRQVMTHELGHMWGLSHQFNFMSVMNYMPSEFRFFGIPYMDDAEAIRAAYPGQAVARTDLGVYLYYSNGYQSIVDATYPLSIAVGDNLIVNNYHVENVGTLDIGTPTIEWYLTADRNYGSAYYYLGTSTYGTLPRFNYFDPPSTSRTFIVPSYIPWGAYYLSAFVRNDSGAAQSSFPYSNDYAFSREIIFVYLPAVTVVASDSSASETGDWGTFTFSRQEGIASELTVNFSVRGTATENSDYSSLGTTVYFAPGASEVTITVRAIDDSDIEGSESVTVEVEAGSFYEFAEPWEATVTISDNDLPSVTVAATDANAGEPSATGTFTFSRTGSTTASLTANINVSGTATSGTDFGSLGTTVVFAAGSVTVTKTVTPIDDAAVEGNETVIVTVGTGAGYAVGAPSAGTVTIQDNDFGGEDLLVDNADGAGQVALVGSWTASSASSGYYGANYLHDGNTGKGSKSATFTPIIGTAGDYQVAIRYTAGSTRASNVPVDIIHSTGTTTVMLNQRINGSQWFPLGTYNFAAGSAGQVRLRTTGTDGFVIADAIQLTGSSLPSVTVVATDSAAAEPNATGTFTFSRSGPITASLTANISVSGTATSGTDFGSLGTTVVFAAGSATATKTVTPIDDAAVEGNETVIVTVVAGAGYAVGAPSVGTVTIQDNDSSGGEDLLVDNADGAGQVALVGSWTASSASAGYYGANYLHDSNTGKGTKSATFTPTVGTAGDYQVAIRYTAGSTRASNVPVDIIHSTGTTTVMLNQRINGSQWFPLGTYNFAAGTGGQVRLRTTGTDGYVIADAIQLTGSSLPSVTVVATDSAAAEPNATGTFTFSRSGPTTASLTANIAVSGTATSGADFSSLGTTVVFAAGSATATKIVTPIDDAVVEGNETVIATVMAGPSYSVGSPSVATVTIQDNDSAVADLLVDNSDGAQVEVVGAWSASTSTSGYFGVNYLQDGNSGKGTKSVTFIPTVGTAGSYEVFIWYTAGSNRASNVPVDIIHSGGTTTRIVNQRVAGSQWVSLGVYNFAAGTAGRVRLRTTGTDGYVLADAIKFQ